MDKALLVIPARWQASRFPGKPLHLIAGKPLLRRVWERCLRARTVARIIIATDDMRIAEAAFGWGAEISLTSARHRSGTDRVAEVAARARDFSIIVNVQGDEPLIDRRLIDRVVATLKKERSIGIVTAAHSFDDASDALSPHQVKVVTDLSGNALYFSRAPIPFHRENPAKILRHQGIYAFRREVLLRFVKWKPSPLERAESLEQLRALENGVRVHVLVTKQGSPGIDTPADAAALERRLARSRTKRNRLVRSSRAKPKDPAANREATFQGLTK